MPHEIPRFALHFASKILLLLAALVLLAKGSIDALESPPRGIQPIGLTGLAWIHGPWFEVARLDNEVERDQSPLLLIYPNTESSLRMMLSKSNGGPWERIAKWTGRPEIASFTIPCWRRIQCGYHIIAADSSKHQWMMVTGHDRSYFWIFARAPGLDEHLFTELKERARAWGYDVDTLVTHNHPTPIPKDFPKIPKEFPKTPDIKPTPRMDSEPQKIPDGESIPEKSLDMLPMSEPPSMPMEGPPPMPAEGPPPMPNAGPPPMSPAPPPMPENVPEPMGPIYGIPDDDPANPEQR